MSKDNFHGVHVQDPCHEYWIFSGWDVPTIAVWDTRCMYDVEVFTNAGAWQYNVEAPTPTAEATQEPPKERSRGGSKSPPTPPPWLIEV